MELKDLEIRASELRGEINETAKDNNLDESGVKKLDELRSEYGTVEARVRAMKAVEDRTVEGKVEDRAFGELTGRASLARYAQASIEMRAIDGAEAELNQELGISGHGAFPLALLAEDGVEDRATTDANTSVSPRGWLDRLFADTGASDVGITFETVASGKTSHPVTTAGPDPRQKAREQTTADGAWSVAVTEIEPSRMSSRLVYTMEDAARLPGLESALRRDLRMSMNEKVDRAIFLGDDGTTGNAADITGLDTAAIAEIEVNQTNKVKADKLLSAILGLVDGRHAASLGDLRMVASVPANSLWQSTIANAAAENQTVASFLREAGLSWSVRADLADATTNGKFGAFIGRSRGLSGAGVAAVWNAGQMIVDPYTKAATGEVAVTFHYLWGFELPRASNFARVKFVSN